MTNISVSDVKKEVKVLQSKLDSGDIDIVVYNELKQLLNSTDLFKTKKEIERLLPQFLGLAFGSGAVIFISLQAFGFVASNFRPTDKSIYETSVISQNAALTAFGIPKAIWLTIYIFTLLLLKVDNNKVTLAFLTALAKQRLSSPTEAKPNVRDFFG